MTVHLIADLESNITLIFGARELAQRAGVHILQAHVKLQHCIVLLSNSREQISQHQARSNPPDVDQKNT